LDTLSKTFRDARPDSALQNIAYRILQRAIAVLGRQYVLGESLSDAYGNGRKLARAGYSFSYDMLGEAAMTAAAAQDFHRSYIDAVEFLASRAADRYSVSVKLSALHPRFEERHREDALPILTQRILDIAQRARKANLQLTIDAEESDRLELTLDVFEHLLDAPELQGWNGLGLAVQAYQRRALAVIDYLGALVRQRNIRINIRLVKGAYWDTEIKRAQQLGLADYPIFIRKCDTDVSYLACAQRLLEEPDAFFPQFATHNAHTLAAICEIAKQMGNAQFELQRLHGMGEHVHGALVRAGYRSRIYAPIGPRRELLPYLVRRLLENGASSSFVRQLTDDTIPVDQLARDPIHLAITHTLSRPGVSAPTVVRNQSWPAAQGIDLTMRIASAALLNEIHKPRETVVASTLIDGSQHAGIAREIFNPANRDQRVGSVVEATESQVDLAVASAANAHKGWSDTPPQLRAKTLERVAQLLEARAPEFIRLAVIEAGKTLDDGVGEVREAVDFCRYYAAQCELLTMVARRPLGVVACISPWNFPLAIFLGQIAGALAAGNTVVAKPAEQTPLIAMQAVRLLHEAGIPADVLQLIPGDGRIGAALVGHRSVDGVVFTGSMATAKAIANALVDSHRGSTPFIAETGGINAMIVDCTALPEQAVRDILISAFQSAGQRCSALRLLCLQEDIADRVLALLQGALAELKIGDPSRLETDIGPLIDADAQQQVLAYLRSKKTFAAAAVESQLMTRGTFVAPSILEVRQVREVDREVFGPVLHVLRYSARDLPTVVDEINGLGYGLTLGIHSRIRRRVQGIVGRARVGNIYVNRHQVGAVVGQQPFGGCGLSGTGPKAGGPHYLLRLSQPITDASTSRYQLGFLATRVTARVRSALTDVRQAQAEWSRLPRRSERVQFACELLAANTSHALSAAARSVRLPSANDLSATLASIAGEENIFQLLPRGVLLCLDLASENLDVLASQILMSIATGNGVLAVVNAHQATAINELIAELQQMGVQDNLVVCIETDASQICTAWLTDLEIDGVVFDGNAECRQRIAALLNRRDGALLPLLSSNDDINRFGIEQTVTINTAAAGGDPRLLTLAN
jgi:RHH-type proline utilization regulon transcriptional repressor/proline dehydrogenase/delta 1-pyrroline-5-carboxylate dehydrogenase